MHVAQATGAMKRRKSELGIHGEPRRWKPGFHRGDHEQRVAVRGRADHRVGREDVTAGARTILHDAIGCPGCGAGQIGDDASEQVQRARSSSTDGADFTGRVG